MPGPQRARPAGPEQAYSRSSARSGTKFPFLATSYLEIAHWSILLRGIEGHGEALDENGCFTSRTCVLRLDRYGSSGYFFFEKHSLIDFQIGKGRKREFRAAELRFSLHKEFCAAEIRFYLYKEYVGAILKKIVILLKENWSHMDNFKGAMLMKIVILLKENWSHMDKFQWGQISISNDVVMMMRDYRPFPFRNRSSLSTHFVK